MCIPFIISNVGLETYGLWAYIFISQGIGSLLVLGVSKSLIQNMAHKNDHFSYWFGVKRFLIFMLVCMVGVTLSVVLIFERSNVEMLGLTKLQSIQAIISFSLCCASALILDYSKGFFEAINKVYLAHTYSFLHTLVLYFSICVAVFLDADLVTMYLVASLSFFIIAVVSQSHIYVVFTRGIATSSVVSLKHILSQSRHFAGFDLLTSLVIPLNRLVIAASFGGGVSHGIFDIGLKLATSASGLLMAFSTHLHAHFRLMVAKGKDNFRLVKNMISFLFLLYLSGLTTFYFLSEFILNYIGLESSASEILFILLACIALTGVCEPALKALWSQGNAVLSFQIKVFQFVFNVILLLSLYDLGALLRVSLAYGIPLALGCSCYVFLFFSRYRNKS